MICWIALRETVVIPGWVTDECLENSRYAMTSDRDGVNKWHQIAGLYFK